MPEAAEDTETLLSVGPVSAAASGDGELHLIGSGKDFAPGGVIVKLVVPRFIGGDDGSQVAGVTVGFGGPGSNPGTGGGGDFSVLIVGDGLLPLAFKGSATAEEKSDQGEEEMRQVFHGQSGGMKADF